MLDLQALVNLLVLVIGAYVAVKELRNKNAAGDVSVSNSWQDYVKELKEQNTTIKAENTELKGRLSDMESMIEGMSATMEKQERKIQKLTAQVVLLETQLRSRNIAPIQFDEELHDKP